MSSVAAPWGSASVSVSTSARTLRAPVGHRDPDVTVADVDAGDAAGAQGERHQERRPPAAALVRRTAVLGLHDEARLEQLADQARDRGARQAGAAGEVGPALGSARAEQGGDGAEVGGAQLREGVAGHERQPRPIPPEVVLIDRRQTPLSALTRTNARYQGAKWSRSHTLGRAHGRICPRDGVPPSPSSPRRPSPSPSPPGRHPVPPPRPHAGARPRPPTRLPYQDPSLPISQRVADLLGRMTLAEKIGQMTQAERASIDADTTQDHHRQPRQRAVRRRLGADARTRPTAWADMVDRYQAAALDTRLGIPLIYGIDTVHGDGNMHGATVFPHNIGLGATRDPALVRDVEHIAASETRSSGPQWAFAPCVCVARDDRWGRTYESFGETPALVEKMETAIDGLQGTPGHLVRQRPGARHRQALRRRRPHDVRHRVQQPDDRHLPDRPGRRPGQPRDVPTGSRSRRTSPAVQAAPRRLGDAVVLRRRLDRGRSRQPDQHARQPAT